MYYGRQTVGMYDKDDEKNLMYGGSLIGRDAAQNSANNRAGVEADDAAARQEYFQNQMQQQYQAAHERNLQAAEQQRRAFDSQANAAGQAMKYSVLSGLLRGVGGGSQPIHSFTSGGRRVMHYGA